MRLQINFGRVVAGAVEERSSTRHADCPGVSSALADSPTTPSCALRLRGRRHPDVPVTPSAKTEPPCQASASTHAPTAASGLVSQPA
ncbi:unnamed protein product [Heligmosomoides polygyrus]|uniref:Uncharacterized protein n=1 Tax=Heligmosomoides polygyrus TaxID=6339 RepID=A0A183G330_HELPZ|nr:unnamed protein product [Heligmosomoides polygyrus]